MSSPYQVGEVICLETLGKWAIGKDVQVRIEKLYSPWTLSCVMEVSILNPQTNTTKAVLKLYDWRHAAQLRKDNKIDSWTSEHETAYINFIHSGQAKDFLDKLRNDDDFEEPEEGWNMAENETYLYNTCTDMFRAETAVYKKLYAYQGKQIPNFFAPITLSTESLNKQSSHHREVTSTEPSSSNSVSPEKDQVDTKAFENELFRPKGILIELIEGFTLAGLNQHIAPKSSWQSIIDQAIQIVNLLSDHDILNEDVRASNILVSPRSNGLYRVCMIDFAQCRLRERDESDLDWGRAKWRQDEEGAVGLVMKTRLAKKGFKLDYTPSMRYLDWAAREGDATS
ncbi:Nn.00g066590.m01.CDS01 [Neocucurbitaria sp. VM-36]